MPGSDTPWPGPHRKLIQSGTDPADSLSYHLSSFNTSLPGPATGFDMWWKEATFTGPNTQGPPLAMPLHIDVGNRVPYTSVADGADRTRTDLTVNGQKFTWA